MKLTNFFYGGQSPLCATLNAVGQGALGDRVPHKIEMFYNGMVKRSDKQNTKTNKKQ